jgi:hypothetical protein
MVNWRPVWVLIAAGSIVVSVPAVAQRAPIAPYIGGWHTRFR